VGSWCLRAWLHSHKGEENTCVGGGGVGEDEGWREAMYEGAVTQEGRARDRGGGRERERKREKEWALYGGKVAGLIWIRFACFSGARYYLSWGS